MQARFYHPGFGRFTAPDPARDQHFEDTQSWNIYSYVRNSPVMSTDPTGMVEEDKKNATETKGPQGGMSGTDDYSRLWQNAWNKWAQTDKSASIPLSPGLQQLQKMTKADFAKMRKETVDREVGGITNTVGGLENVAKDGAILSYSLVKKAIKGLGEEAHHLIEQRFAKVMGEKAGEMLATGVTKAEHQVFTSKWRALIPYGKGTLKAAEAGREYVMKAAGKVYADHPEIMRALGL